MSISTVPYTLPRCRAKSSTYPPFILIKFVFSQVVTLRTRRQRGRSGGDAVLLQVPTETKKLSVGCGELLLQLADGGSAFGAFLAELGGEDVHDVAGVLGGGSGGWDAVVVGLLGA